MVAALLLSLAFLAPPDFAAALTDSERTLAQSLVATFRGERLGPYNGILWFCNDGTQQQPHLNGCVGHEGGAMYATFSPQAQRLFKLGIYGGTVLTALTIDDLIASDFYRARALVIESYLERSLSGWLIERAKTFRGFRQDEDEAESARRLLIELCGDREMLDHGRAVVIRLTRALPYGRGAEALADEIRTMAAAISDADRSFADLRFKIHSLPEPSDTGKVEAYAQGRTDAVGDQARALAAALHRYYDPAMRLERLRAVKGWLAIKPVRDAIQALLDVNPTDTLAVIDKGAALIEAAGGNLLPTQDPKAAERNLLRLHTISIVEGLWVAASADLSKRALSRRQAFDIFAKFVRCAQLAGLLSTRERDTALAELRPLANTDSAGYGRGVRNLGRVLEWARARLDFELGVPLARYQAVEPKSALVIDDILRSGMMLPLAALYDRIATDAERLAGGGDRLVGLSVSAEALRGENAGLTVGPLRVIGPGADPSGLESGAIALLSELPPDLPKVAGVLTIAPPGSLSHVALLARNLGIPLAAVGGDIAAALAPHAGERFVLGVSSGRRVLLAPWVSLSPAEQAQLTADKAEKDKTAGATLTIDVQRLDLTTARILRRDEVAEADAGIRVGPKAAELGHLKRLFPTRVADAAVIPFGVFVRHVDTPVGGAPTPFAELKAAYARFATARASGNPDKAEADMLAALARFREQIMTRPFAPGFEAEVRQALTRMGPPGSFGVYVRSDTNVEDLKDFTGAGLNLTVFNRVAVRDILQAIREVWASPFAERSFRFRQDLITNPEQAYPSVLLHRTVPGETSGVILTTDFESSDPAAFTISAGEGVSAVVDGGAPETLVVSSNGSVRLLASARSPTRKIIPKPPAQGVVLAAALGKEPLLSDREILQLRGLVEEVRAKMPPRAEGVPWDIEYGLVAGKAFLMQIRPLKTARTALVPLLTQLDTNAHAPATAVALDEALP